MDWLILTACQPNSGYFMPWNSGITFTVRSYLQLCVIVSKIDEFIYLLLHTVLSNAINV